MTRSHSALKPESRAALERCLPRHGFKGTFKGVAYYQNENGTYDGAGLMSDLTGLSRDEILWTWRRLKELMQVQGIGKEEAKRIVAIEAKNRPWESK